jgi:ankyrin repeat protein
LRYKCKKESSGETALHLATSQNHINVVKCFLENGADFRIWDNSEKSAFFLAVNLDFVEIARELIIKGADVNDTENKNPFSLSYINGNLFDIFYFFGKLNE